MMLRATLLVVGAAIVSMVVYGVGVRRRDADADKKGARFLLGIGDFLLHWFMWLLSPVERLALRLGMGPDAFNLAGLGSGALSGVLIALGHLELGGFAIALGGVADILDGRVARALGVDSAYGKFIDSTLDRFVEVFAFLGFAVYLSDFRLGPLVVVGAISGSLLVSYARARGESLGVLCKGGLMQRAERLVITCLACLADPALTERLDLRPGSIVLGALGLIAVLTFATAAHRTVWISRRLREADRSRAADRLLP
jgi:CDP-diacylglycerol---glycerol-3-phosphate 3-phosphatidyltransferase